MLFYFMNKLLVFRTNPSPNPVENIRTIYGSQIAKELISIDLNDDVLRFKLQMYLTKINYSMKKSILLFFINHRLVDSAALKACIDQIYSTYLPKGCHPFVYLSLEIEPNNVDVNVHPTKHEVHFLHEDEIIDKIKDRVEREFVGGNEVRVFYTQSRLPGASEPTNSLKEETNKSLTENKVAAKDLVRTDSKSQKLDKFFGAGAAAVQNSTTMVGSTSLNLSQETENLNFSRRKINKMRM